MRKQYLFIIGGVIFLMALFYWQDHYVGSGNMKPSEESAVEGAASESAPAPQESFTNSETATPAPVAATATVSTVDPAIQRQFATALKEIGRCLEIANTVNGDQVDPTLGNLLNSLTPALGEMTVYTDDWTQIDVQYTDGVTRRIRTEINYDQPGNPTKYLQIYKLNDQKIPEIEELDEQTSTNPSDDYLQSLQTGANVLLNEKGGRAYFAGGEEMAVIEQNGKVDSFTMTRNNKTINCSSLVSGSSCQCY